MHIFRQQLGNLISISSCFLLLLLLPLFATQTSAIGIKSILSATGNGCPSNRSIEVSSVLEDSKQGSTVTLTFADLGPHAVLSKGAVDSRWCEIELELDVPRDEFIYAVVQTSDLNGDGMVAYGEGYSASREGHEIQVMTHLEWPGVVWYERDFSAIGKATARFDPDFGDEPFDFSVSPYFGGRAEYASLCSWPPSLGGPRPTLMLYQRWAVTLSKPGYDYGDSASPDMRRGGVLSSKLQFRIFKRVCS